MSIIDRVIAAVTPPESDEARQEARAKAENYAASTPWLATVLDHHRQIESAFAEVYAAQDAGSRKAALKDLGAIITGHVIAEEAVIYPTLSDIGESGHATMAYTEQAAAKMQLGLLERIDPMSEDFTDKLGHLQGAVSHHMYEEEGTWFPELIDGAGEADHVMIDQRYNEEFERYCGGGSGGGSTSSSELFAGRDSSNLVATPEGLASELSPPSGQRDRFPTGTVTDDTAGGDDMMAPGKSTASLPEFR